MTGRRKFSSRLTALFLAVVLLVTPIIQVPVYAEGTISKIADSTLVQNLGKITPAVKGVTAGIEFASKVYNAVEYAMDAEDGQGFKAFLDCFMGKVEEPSMSDIANTLDDIDGKIDSISVSVDELSEKMDDVLNTLNSLVTQLGTGIEDMSVQLYEGQLQMQNWTRLYNSVNGFYTKYSNVRGTLQNTITTLSNRAADYDVFLSEIDKLSNAAEIHTALSKLNADFSNYDTLNDSEKALLNTTVTVGGTSTTIYTYAKDYVAYVQELLDDTYEGFTGSYEVSMYDALTNMSSAILGTQWQSEGQGGIGEIYYKLCVMEYSNNEKVHDAYQQFVASVQYDFLLTAYVCTLALRSQVATGTAQEAATAMEQLDKIYNLIGRVMIYSEYEHEKCVNTYDYPGFMPDGNLTCEDYVVYYGNTVNALAGYPSTRIISKKALSLGDNLEVTNQHMHLSAGETAQFKVWCDGYEIQSGYSLYSSNDCVEVNADGTVVALRPGTAIISMKVQGSKRDVAVVTVSSSFAKYNGSGTNTYIYYEGTTKKTIRLPGVGYEYEYCSEITALPVSQAVDSSKDRWVDLSDYLTFENGADVGDFTVAMNHKYGRIQESGEHKYLQFTYAGVGAVTLTRVVDGQKCVVVVPIVNEDDLIADNSEVKKEDSDTSIYYIYTKEDLLQWRADCEKNNTQKVNVKLMADIDFEWDTWEGLQYALMETVPGASMTGLKDQSSSYKTYTFDGNGHTIKNITFVPTTVDMYVYGESDTEREVVQVDAYGFFAKLGGTIKNLTIENVKYSGYPTGNHCNGRPQILSVFAAIANSEIHGKDSYSDNVTHTWVSEISNCRATGLTEDVFTRHVVYYNPFGNLLDQMNGKTNQHITVKNNVYDMHFKLMVDGQPITTNDYCWVTAGVYPPRYVSIFNSTDSNIYAGNVSCHNVVWDDYTSQYLYTELLYPTNMSLMWTEGMTDADIATAKQNLIVFKGSILDGNDDTNDLWDYQICSAGSSNREYWISHGWNEDAVDRMMNGNAYPLYEGDYAVDISKIKGYYFVGEALDIQNVFVNGVQQQSYTMLDSIDTPGTKRVSLSNDRAVFTVEYVDFVELNFTDGTTTHTYNVVSGTTFTMPNALFTSTQDGMVQGGWQLENSSTTYTLGQTITVAGAATFEPTWNQGTICTVEFGTGDDKIIIKVPENTTITVPYPVGYDTNSYYDGQWKCDDRTFLDPNDPYAGWTDHNESVYFGSSFVVTTDHHFDSYLRGMPKPIPFKINIYFQNLNDDDYSYMGTYSSQTSSSTIYPEYQRALSSVGISGSIYNVPRDYIDKFEAFNCGGDHSSAYGLTLIRGEEVSEITLWIRRPSHTVTWLDIDGNTISTDTVRYGVMPTAPADADAAPAGYTPVWNKTFAVVTNDVTYQVSQLIPMSGIEYTVNHMWQNINDDEYTVHESETLTGTTGEDTAAVARDYTGFTVQTFTQVEIAGDGTTVVNIYYNRNEYTVTWDIEGVTTTENYRYGATPSWKGEIPVKTTDPKYNYTFVGWGDIQPVTDHATYTAQFKSELNTFVITWDIDGVTTTEVYTYGDTPLWKGEAPTREATAQYTYTFAGWGEITEVTGDKTYTATFDATVNKYTITWVVEGDSFEEEYEYGETPSYKGTKPIKPSDEAGSYAFNGWGQIETVTGDKTYTAQFISTASTYTITWDVNGDTLTELYTYGDMPSYKGVTPVKPATAQYTYTFAGWGEITEVTGNKTYSAQFTETVNKYTITWNIDGNQITEEYEYGATPSYKGATPKREADAQYTYSFRDWGTILTVTGDKTYTATFDTTVNKYNITWIIDGVQFTESYDYGAMPVYKGYTPTKDANAQYTYTFAGWGEIVKVTGNKTYTAIFDSTVNQYTITWNIDGTEITEEYEYGAMPSYKGETPTRAGNAQYTYTFKDFGSVLSVTGDKTYTAQFIETVNKYTVTWVINGVETTEEYEYGATPSYKGETPTKDGNAQVEYIFTGWGEIAVVTGDATYTAQFVSSDKTYTITWVVDGQQTVEQYKYGAIPSYKGGIPNKENTAKYTYTFAGWGVITEVTGDKTYTAVFTETVNKYTITWNIDGTLTTEEYEYGATPSYKGATPSKAATAQYTYTFKDWGTITEVTGDKTYTANFTSAVNKYTITWVVNGEQFTEEYEYGATPVYKGYKPTKPATAQYTYDFSGWGEITKVTEDKTYTAVFNKTVNKYTITWDVDGVKTTEVYEYGATPSYKGETPEREADAENTYTFIGWGQIEAVTGNKTYTAQFTETVNAYTITWNINGEEITESYPYGATPSYKGETPVKQATAQYTYTFAGWGEITKVTGDKTYTAVFTSTVNKYTITWDIDGDKTTEEYEYGATPSYKGATPSKEATAQYTYAFSGWGGIEKVTGNKTYTAVFSSTVNKYKITWNIDGTLTTEEYEYGATPSYKGATPSKAATAQYTYTFKDWGAITEVTGDKTYTANFTSAVNKYTITWVVGGEQFNEEYEYGATPVYKGYKPTKPATAQYTYEFSGWGEITKVTGNKTYTAIFDATYIVPDEITSSTYNVGEDTISKIVANTSSKEFIAAINESKYCKVFKGDSVVSDDTAVGTGMTVDIVDGDKTNASYTIIVTGDTNGDGNITITDMLAIKAHVLGKTELTGAYAVAADTNGDGAITITDFLQLKAQLLGKGDIEAR